MHVIIALHSWLCLDDLSFLACGFSQIAGLFHLQIVSDVVHIYPYTIPWHLGFHYSCWIDSFCGYSACLLQFQRRNRIYKEEQRKIRAAARKAKGEDVIDNHHA